MPAPRAGAAVDACDEQGVAHFVAVGGARRIGVPAKLGVLRVQAVDFLVSVGRVGLVALRDLHGVLEA